ncbi:hypothetical protein C0583_05070 [Candidatus Parcubacteria bacterium]|nr:MAG: hypothetical protein C0583_05070 [Candidatus Parcubacteria bacterium]
MKKLNLEKNKQALVVVAHPDDEVIWMGGTILNNPEVNWTVYSMCRESDADREPKFRRVCKYLGVRGIISDLDDGNELNEEILHEEAKNLLDKNITEDFDYIFCHGENGEYGHSRHKIVNRAVKQFITNKNKKPEAVFYFSYKKVDDQDARPLAVASDEAEFMVDLDKETYEKKKRIVGEMYGYPMDGIDVGYCTNPEAFSQIKN